MHANVLNPRPWVQGWDSPQSGMLDGVVSQFEKLIRERAASAFAARPAHGIRSTISLRLHMWASTPAAIAGVTCSVWCRRTKL